MPYLPHPQHRDIAFARQKSQWCISVVEETQIFTYAVEQKWTNTNTGWGLHLVDDAPSILGTTTLPYQFPVKIAKFVGNPTGNWHGYPVAHWLAPYDKPAVEILEMWKEKGFINQPTFSKIYRGKRCNL